MSRPAIRFAALAGAAAVAFGIATPAVAAAVEHTATVHSAASTATPIRVDGRVVTVVMPTTHYAATGAHSDAIVNVAYAGPSAIPATNVTPATNNVTPANVSGGTIGVGIVGLMLIGVIVFIGIKGRKVAASWAITLVALGVLLDGTFVGPLIKQLTNSAVTAAANTLGNF
jgi:hypothetical protein